MIWVCTHYRKPPYRGISWLNVQAFYVIVKEEGQWHLIIMLILIYFDGSLIYFTGISGDR
jgi:hypothetical protein